MSHTVIEHFEGKSPQVREMYDLLVAAGREFGPVVEDPKKTSIHLNRRSAFAGVATQKTSLILTLKAMKEIADPRVQRTLQASSRRWYVYLKITDPSMIDAKLLGWLRDSYELSA